MSYSPRRLVLILLRLNLFLASHNTMTLIHCLAKPSSSSSSNHRPALVQEALAANADLYYFGVGSNLSRSKVESRAVDKSPIQIKSMEPALVHGYRLAFNMRGFPPLEPGMGSIEPLLPEDEPAAADSRPLLPYERQECHGALIRVTAENYEKIMRSEGVGNHSNNTNTGYEEVVLDVTPYKGKVVRAVALRARPQSRLARDPCPSQRYMDILREGARELGLRPCYQEWLQNHPVQRNVRLVEQMAVRNLAFTFGVSQVLKTRILSKLQSELLFAVYVPSGDNHAGFKSAASHVATGLILFPGAVLGWLWLLVRRVVGKPPSPMMKLMLDRYG